MTSALAPIPTSVGAVGAPDTAAALTAWISTEVDFCSLRHVARRSESVEVRDGVVEPVSTSLDEGVMVTVWHQGGLGYAATSDISQSGIEATLAQARRWAEATAGITVIDGPPAAAIEAAQGHFETDVTTPWTTTTLADRIALLTEVESQLRIDERIVDSAAWLQRVDTDSTIVSGGRLAASTGAITQRTRVVHPGMMAVANSGSNTQRRSFGGGSFNGQGGVEILERFGFGEAAPRVAEQAIELLDAPNAPTGDMHLLLAPDQMILQIHESIGHPLELDRILGDERNYAGTSFVTPDMFGSYQYGSPLLNVTFDPDVAGQMASYAFDDDGTPAERQYLIRDGVLERGLGGAISQARTGLDGVANSRACNWNRPPIDRMANLNVEPGDSTFDELVAQVERGIYMETNNSWSIDDSRNKFQFGCEYATLIEDGELTTTVRNPGYRGISATFWRNLVGVGNRDSFTVMGTPNCGKGEPNQVIEVGHASPACLFADVAVFGGDQ